MLGTILLILITILFPPLGVFIVSGCSMDLLINILLTVLGYIPGHIHAFYVEYVSYHAAERHAAGLPPAGGVYSQRSYGTIE